ncbi:MAG TPA: secondary thiamine-phosphate synthase enzyme YjbQ [Rhodanobacteraceae bacterium]|nr:secondary thiamine-phosphate synthase enzyme YjbQ [Rhodanobacteraceae bacterium]
MTPLPAPRIATANFEVRTPGRGFVELDDRLRGALAESGVHEGVAHIFTPHTSCSLMICENADPVVREDLERFFSRLVRDGDPLFQHDAEGPDDMPAHVRSILAGVNLGVPVRNGELALGTWQGVYLWEHRAAPHMRKVCVTIIGCD